jgi:hypothetical protein
MRYNTSHRGRTDGGRYTYRPLVEYEPDDFPADSNYWHGRAMTEVKGLIEVLGKKAYNEWCIENVDDKGLTWKDIANLAAEATKKALELAAMQEPIPC